MAMAPARRHDHVLSLKLHSSPWTDAAGGSASRQWTVYNVQSITRRHTKNVKRFRVPHKTLLEHATLVRCRRAIWFTGAHTRHLYILYGLAVWRRGSALVSINVVALRRARLVLGWVIVRWFVVTILRTTTRPIHRRFYHDEPVAQFRDTRPATRSQASVFSFHCLLLKPRRLHAADVRSFFTSEPPSCRLVVSTQPPGGLGRRIPLSSTCLPVSQTTIVDWPVEREPTRSSLTATFLFCRGRGRRYDRSLQSEGRVRCVLQQLTSGTAELDW